MDDGEASQACLPIALHVGRCVWSQTASLSRKTCSVPVGRPERRERVDQRGRQGPTESVRAHETDSSHCSCRCGHCCRDWSCPRHRLRSTKERQQGYHNYDNKTHCLQHTSGRWPMVRLGPLVRLFKDLRQGDQVQEPIVQRSGTTERRK